MPGGPQVGKARSRRRRNAWRVLRWRNTPERIRGLTALAAIFAITLGVVTAAIFASVTSGVREIGDQADPEVNHTTDLYLHLLIGLALLAVLVGLQLLIAARHRRVLNPALAGATLVTVVLATWAAALLGAQASHLFVAKQDAFDSTLALTQARAVSYDGNADESRFLVDPGRAIMYQDAFEAQSQRLARLAGVASVFQYDATLAKAVEAYRANHADVTFGGYFGTEFRNITFTGERAAAQRTLYAYQVYQRYDRRIRAFNARGDLRGAIAFDTSLAPGNSNWAFYRYDTDLQALIKINQDAFGQSIAAGESGGTGWNGPFPIIGSIAIIILALVGVRSRLAEYR